MDIRIANENKIKTIDEIKIKNKIVNYMIILSSLLYYIDIFIISSVAGSRNVRLQDVASILAFMVMYHIIKSQAESDKSYQNTVLLMGIFLLYVVIGNIIFYMKGDIDSKTIFYIVKEVEFYACFLIISYFFRNYLNGIYKITQLLMIFIILYGFYQVGTGSISYYGIGTIFETAPSISGSIYLACSVLSFYMYKVFKNKNFKIYAILTYLLTIFTISKTNIIGLTLFYISFFALEMLNKFITKNSNKLFFNKKKVLITMGFLIFLSIIFVIGYNNAKINELITGNDTISRITGRFGRLDSSYSFRSNKASYYLKYFIGNSPIAILFGRGKGITEFAFNVRTLAVDNQFTRAIIEIGIVGITIWTSVIISIISSLKKSNNIVAYHLVISLFIGYLAMGVGYEVFVVTKTGIVFWFLMGVFGSNSKIEDSTI